MRERVEAEVAHGVRVGDGCRSSSSATAAAAARPAARATRARSSRSAGSRHSQQTMSDADRVRGSRGRPRSSMKQVRKCSRNTSLGSRPPKSWPVQRVVVLVDVVGALEEVRDPADAALGQGELGCRGTPGAPRDHSRSAAVCMIAIGCSVIIVVDRRLDRGDRHLPRTSRCAGTRRVPVVLAGLPERIPVLVVEARAAELRGVLREGDGVAALAPPRGAPRRPSAPGPSIGSSASGMNRPGWAPHHSSMCQSL